MAIKLGMRRRFSATFTTDDGTPASVDETQNPVTATVDNGTVEEGATIVKEGKVIGYTGLVRPAAAGLVTLTITADADRGDGVRPVVLTGVEACAEPEATGGTISFDGVDEP